MTYTFEQIKEWKADFDSIQPNIDGNQILIETIDHSLLQYHKELQANLFEWHDETTKKMAEIRSEWSHALSTTAGLSIGLDTEEKEKELADCEAILRMLNETFRQQNIADVMQTLNAAQADHVEFSLKLSGLVFVINNKLAAKNRQVAARSQNIKRRNRLISDNFLNSYNHNIEGLYAELVVDIKAALARYEAGHPAGQSALVKKCIFEVDNAITYLQNRLNTKDRYDILMGMIHQVSDRLTDDDLELRDEILAALAGNHLLDAAEAKIKFEAYRSNEYILKQTFIDGEYQSTERTAYNFAMQQYHQGIRDHDSPVWQNLYDTGYLFAKEIQKEQAVDQHKFDYKYFSKVLVAAKNVIARPDDEANRNCFENLIGFNLSGKSNTARKWHGAGMMLLGAAIAVGSLLVGASMFGLSSPLMIAGYASAGVMMMVGLAVFMTGRQKGVDKQGDNLKKNSMFVAQAVQHNVPQLNEVEVLRGMPVMV